MNAVLWDIFKWMVMTIGVWMLLIVAVIFVFRYCVRETPHYARCICTGGNMKCGYCLEHKR